MIEQLPKNSTSHILTGGDREDCKLSRDVILFLQDEVAQILDFQRGQFYALDHMATLMLSLVLQQGIDAAITEIAQTYAVEEEQVRTDLTQLLENLAAKGLLVKSEKTAAISLVRKIKQNFANASLYLLKIFILLLRRLFNPQASPNRLTVELLLSASWLSFRLLGWSRTLSLWQQWTCLIEPVTDSSEIVQKVDKMVREAAASKLFLPVVCKERALVGYHLLRVFYGLPAVLIVGINHYPFQIHAWVECNGLIVTDDAAHCEPFITVVRYS